MVGGSWFNNDGLFLQFGTQKANPETGGDYHMPGENREIEVSINLANLTTTATAQSITTFFPTGSNVVIEEVQVFTEVGAVGGTSFSVGLGFFSQGTNVTIGGNTYPPVTTIDDIAFVNAMLTATVTSPGQKTVLAKGTTAAGNYIGGTPGDLLGSTSSSTTQANYITAKAVGTFTAGIVKVRIKYHGIGTITQ
jgi:hypothetical protein